MSFNLTEAYLLDQANKCTFQTCPKEWAEIGYIPSLGGNAFYLALFAVILVIQVYLGIKYRTWTFLGAMIGGLILEIMGYVARIQLHINDFDSNAFLLYIIVLTIGPVFFSAALYFCLAHIVTLYGPHLSRIQPRTYSTVFICCDVLSLVIQSVGGGIANAANDHKTSQMGVHIMVAGLAWQVFTLVLYLFLCLEFLWHVRQRRSEQLVEYQDLRKSLEFKLFLYALSIATIAILVRSCFRVAELSEGFSGALANEQVTFMILEGGMIGLACICITVIHPGLAFKGTWKKAKKAGLSADEASL